MIESARSRGSGSPSFGIATHVPPGMTKHGSSRRSPRSGTCCSFYRKDAKSTRLLVVRLRRTCLVFPQTVVLLYDIKLRGEIVHALNRKKGEEVSAGVTTGRIASRGPVPGTHSSRNAGTFDAIASRNFICRTVSRRLPKRSAFNASSPPIPATTVSAPGIGPDHHESTSKPRRPRDASLDVGRVPSEAVCIIATRLRFFSRPALDKWRTPSQHAGAVWISSRHSEQWANSRNKRAEADARKWKTQGRRFASSQNVARRISWLSQSARAVLPSGGRALPLPETRSRWLKRRRVREHNVLHACMRACLRFPTHTPISFSNRHPTPLTFL